MLQNRKISFEQLGFIDYKEAWEYQEKLFNSVLHIKAQNRSAAPEAQVPTTNYLLFCSHPHVYTLGKSGHESHLLIGEEGLKAKDATYYKINRGGDITYHGPGQLVGYPILDLDNFFTDIHKYLRYLEEAIILTLNDYQVTAGRIAGLTGVWLDHEEQRNPRKICAMGVKCSRWVTMHGFAFNINTDLNYFNNIVPCGIADKQVTSLAKELGREVEMAEVEEKLLGHLASLFEASILKTANEKGY
ncbi:lipoyl(octanoyl) transferase LipB [Pontibacter qinzhouensis]|uniref:Octanoyltransferase n=1 Tax=Pontibacter qinzhouensis TaxID=2603253 RepID=A0A5C8JIE0_9BACT|nr:lipoyl(octanoyl) transferase LipB [Pontibacter qinzhouensis]